MAFTWESNVAAVSHEPYKSALLALYENNRGVAADGFKIKIIHNEDNPRDPNALEVYVKGQNDAVYHFVGFVPRSENQNVLQANLANLTPYFIKFNSHGSKIVGLRIGVREGVFVEPKVKNTEWLEERLTQTKRRIMV